MLTEELVLAVIAEVEKRLRERAVQGRSDAPQLEKDAAKLRLEIGRLVSAIAEAKGSSAMVMAAIQERQQQLDALEARIHAAAEAPHAIGGELKGLRAAKQRITELRAMLERQPERARDVMTTLFEEPLKFEPITSASGQRYRVTGTASIGKLLNVAESEPGRFTKFASPAGFEPALLA